MPRELTSGGRDEVSETDRATVDAEVKGLFGRDSAFTALWALQLVLAAGLTPLNTRVLGPAEFGHVTAAIAVMQVVMIVAGFGIQTAAQRAYASQGRAAAQRLLMLCLVTALAVTALADVTERWWAGALGFDGYHGVVRLAVVWAGLAAVTSTALGLLRSEDRLGGFLVLSLLQSVVAEGLAVGLSLTVSARAETFVWGEVVGQVLAAVVGLLLVPPRMFGPRHRVMLVGAMAFALPLVPAALSQFVLGASDRFLVQQHLGPTAVARYGVAYNLGSMPMILLDVLDSIWLPRLFGFGDAHLRSSVVAASRDALYRLLAPMTLGLALGMPVVLLLWAPSSFRPEDLTLLSCVVVVSAVPYAAALSLSRSLLAQGRSRVVAVAALVAAVANVGLNLLLIPVLDLLGAAVATLLAFALMQWVLLVASRGAAAVPRPPSRIQALVAASSAAVVLVGLLPTTPPVLVARGVLVLVCLGWFVAVAAGLAGWRGTRRRPG